MIRSVFERLPTEGVLRFRCGVAGLNWMATTTSQVYIAPLRGCSCAATAGPEELGGTFRINRVEPDLGRQSTTHGCPILQGGESGRARKCKPISDTQIFKQSVRKTPDSLDLVKWHGLCSRPQQLEKDTRPAETRHALGRPPHWEERSGRRSGSGIRVHNSKDRPKIK